MPPYRPILGLLLVAAAVVACADPVPSSIEPAPPSAGAPEGGPTKAEITQAITLRREFGLRSDEAWVRQVAANPAAVMDFGVPLMPFERDEILRRPNGSEALAGAVQAYLAEHADVSGGVYIDQARGGVFTVLVTDDPGPHEAALAELVGPDVVVVRRVRWTETQLNDLQERIAADDPFLDSLPARMDGSSVLIIENVVELSVSSAVPDAVERIVAHYGAQGMLRVISDGTGVLLQPTGRILGRVIAPPGTDMNQLSPQFQADVDIGARDSMGIPVAPDGSFVIDRLPPATYTVTILELGDVGNTEIGRGTVVLPPGAAVSLEIPLDRP